MQTIWSIKAIFHVEVQIMGKFDFSLANATSLLTKLLIEIEKWF